MIIRPVDIAQQYLLLRQFKVGKRNFHIVLFGAILDSCLVCFFGHMVPSSCHVGKKLGISLGETVKSSGKDCCFIGNLHHRYYSLRNFSIRGTREGFPSCELLKIARLVLPAAQRRLFFVRSASSY
ncbi:hypothetical protein HPP92_005366 [Vanilla planifolia]|uniref:Uncharacterized protein n=1 Tax=Vanilla planifolia TaxID=51239 RepID=A0A835RK47_VANPL|nr:hypothetical protein HPP92_005366 [Vanilla planifolia]